MKNNKKIERKYNIFDKSKMEVKIQTIFHTSALTTGLYRRPPRSTFR